MVSLGPMYCYCVASLAPLYEAAGFAQLRSAEAPQRTHEGKFPPSSTGAPGWLVEMFVNLAAKQARKRKPELVLMTRGLETEDQAQLPHTDPHTGLPLCTVLDGAAVAGSVARTGVSTVNGLAAAHAASSTSHPRMQSQEAAGFHACAVGPVGSGDVGSTAGAGCITTKLLIDAYVGNLSISPASWPACHMPTATCVRCSPWTLTLNCAVLYARHLID